MSAAEKGLGKRRAGDGDHEDGNQYEDSDINNKRKKHRPGITRGTLPHFGSSKWNAHGPVLQSKIAADWPATRKWQTAARFVEGVNEDVAVEVSHSRSSIFRGDVGQHSSKATPFLDFIAEFFRTRDPGRSSQARGEVEEEASGAGKESDQKYLCQCPLMNETDTPLPLSYLLEDIVVPHCLSGAEVTSINLWMSPQATRSNVHYDARNNILCVIAGSKSVTLAPPSELSSLGAFPCSAGGGTSANHCTANTVDHAADSQTVMLKEGDGLFIPEGWYHQVDSEAGTIAVNFWWKGFDDAMAGDGTMAPYYIRRIVQRMVEDEITAAIASAHMRYKISPTCDAVVLLRVARSLNESVSIDDAGTSDSESSDDKGDVGGVVSSLMPAMLDETSCPMLIDALSFESLKLVTRECLSLAPVSLAQCFAGLDNLATEILTRKMEKCDVKATALESADNQAFYSELFGAIDKHAEQLIEEQFAKLSRMVPSNTPAFSTLIPGRSFVDLMLLKKWALAADTQAKVLAAVLGR